MVKSKSDFIKKINFFFKLRITFFTLFKKRLWNFNDYLIGLRKKKGGFLNVIIEPYKLLNSIIQWIQVMRNWILVGSSILFIDGGFETGELFSKKVSNINQFCISKPLNISGVLSNYQYMRWHHLKSFKNTIPFKKPDLLILFEITRPYNSIINEAHNLNIPIISCIDFTDVNFYRKYSYPIFMPIAEKEHNKLFYLDMITYFYNTLSGFNYVQAPLLSSDKSNLNSLTDTNIVPSFFDNTEDLNESDLILLKNPSMDQNMLQIRSLFIKEKYTKNLPILLYNIPLNKWQWYKRKKFKRMSLYYKNFILKGKFRPPFSKWRWRYTLLKRLFCNLFDIQHNFKTWWRETIKKGTFTRLKKFSKNFKSSEHFLFKLERNISFLVKKVFRLSPRSIAFGLKNKQFLVDNNTVNSLYHIVRNGSIIQKALYNTDLKTNFDLFDITVYNKSALYSVWRQEMFRRIFFLGDYRLGFTPLGVPLVPPAQIDLLEKKKKLHIFYRKKVNFWKKYGLLPLKTRIGLLKKLFFFGLLLKKNGVEKF